MNRQVSAHKSTPTLSNSEKVSAPTRLKRKNHLLDLLGENVIVQVEDFEVKGRLLAFTPGNKQNHLPTVLVIKSHNGIHLIRYWQTIKLNPLNLYVYYNRNIKVTSF